MKKEYSLLMPFIDESESFCLGYECGTIAQKLDNGSVLIEYLIHTENSAQIQMICDLYNIKCEIKVQKDTGWSLLTTHGGEAPNELFGDDSN